MSSRVQRLKWRIKLVKANLIMNAGGTCSRAGCSICHRKWFLFFLRENRFFSPIWTQHKGTFTMSVLTPDFLTSQNSNSYFAFYNWLFFFHMLIGRAEVFSPTSPNKWLTTWLPVSHSASLFTFNEPISCRASWHNSNKEVVSGLMDSLYAIILYISPILVGNCRALNHSRSDGWVK